jgi:hypothetical protein
MCEDFVFATKDKRVSDPFIRDKNVVDKVLKVFNEVGKSKDNVIKQKGYVYVILGMIMENIGFENAKRVIDTNLSSSILFYINENYKNDISLDMIAAESAAITHGHDLGYIPAAALVHIIHLVSHCKDITLLDAVNDMIDAMQELFANARHIIEFTDIMSKAVALSKSDIADIDAIHMLGEGWVAEETLAIAIYCALKHQNDFKKAVVAAVNHKGDSDSTGAVTGNILGAYLGMSAIPAEYLDKLELKNIILELADDLYNDCPISERNSCSDEIWAKKYIDKTYIPRNN